MGRLLQEHEGWTREDLDEIFGPHPDHASAPTRVELEAELAAEVDKSYDDLDENEPSLSDDEIKAAVRAAMVGCHEDDELRHRIRKAIGYDSAPAIASTSTGHGSMKMTLFMVMLHGPRGNTISI